MAKSDNGVENACSNAQRRVPPPHHAPGTRRYLEKFGKPFPIDEIRAAVRAIPRKVKWP
jgi:hypothetical protein